MSLKNTPSAERTHIGIFGLRNAGKSSLLNKVTNQNISIVSDVLGTTTDPVRKSMELLPLGPVTFIDTPGIDDDGTLGSMRIQKTKKVLNIIDIAILVLDATLQINEKEQELIDLFKKKNIPYLLVYNKSDLLDKIPQSIPNNEIYVSAKTGLNIELLKETLSNIANKKDNKKIVSDLVKKGDKIVLVIPIDKGAPKGRIILPQQLVLRELIDSETMVIVTNENNISEHLNNLNEKPNLVITDSQVFGKVNRSLPNDILLTSFSILLARYKGNLNTLVKGASALDNLKDNDTILISEGCTHHRQCEDIGTVKLPKWIKEYTNKNINFEFSSGTEFPEDLSKYSLILHCGGCMINEREMHYRLEQANDANIPITNYGMTIAKINGILDRSLEIFNK